MEGAVDVAVGARPHERAEEPGDEPRVGVAARRHEVADDDQVHREVQEVEPAVLGEQGEPQHADGEADRGADDPQHALLQRRPRRAEADQHDRQPAVLGHVPVHPQGEPVEQRHAERQLEGLAEQVGRAHASRTLADGPAGTSAARTPLRPDDHGAPRGLRTATGLLDR